MKKVFVLLLTLAMTLSLAACGGDDTATEDTTSDNIRYLMQKTADIGTTELLTTEEE